MLRSGPSNSMPLTTSGATPITTERVWKSGASMVLPKASCPGQKRAAVAWLTIATDVSPERKLRPRRMGIWSTSKYSGETLL